MIVPLKRNIVRDFIVYFISSFQSLLLKGELLYFIKDILSFPKWRKYIISSTSIVDQRIPWMTFEVIHFLNGWLKKSMIAYEYGSGGSTLFFSDRVQRIFSIEHDEVWFNNLNSVIEKETIQNIEYRLYSPVIELNSSKKDCSNPVNYLSCLGEFKDLNFEKYVKSIDEFPDHHFDLIIIDGRARPSCILHSMQKLKKGGILLVDNTDRAYYLKPFPELFNKNMWQQKTFQGHTPFGLTSVLYTTILFTKKCTNLS